jgi:Zn-dependent protease
MDYSSKAKAHAGRRERPRRDGDRPDPSDRRESERRQSSMRRYLVHFFHTHSMPKAADVVKTTKLIEPLLTIVTLFLSGLTNSAAMGVAGIAVLIALIPHEFGHLNATRAAGYHPRWFWFIPLLGAVMRLPDIKTRAHEAHIAYGGPFFGLLFTSFVSLLWWGTTFVHANGIWVTASNFLYTTALVSVVLNLFNLIPVSPLDGGRVCQGFDGAWPKHMRVTGFLLLILVTAMSGQATMLVIWILAIGEIRLEWRGHVIAKKWKFVISSVIFLAMLFGLVTQFAEGGLFGWKLVGEGAYTLLAAYIIRGYFKEWKQPELYRPYREMRRRPVDHREGKIMRMKYFALLSSLTLVFVLLVASVGLRLH